MKNLGLLVLLVFVTATAKGQTTSSSPANEQCTLSVAQFPDIRGIRLAMSVDKLEAVFPEDENRVSIDKAVKESKRVDNYGHAHFTLQPNKEAPNPKFSGVNWVGIEIVDEHVASFNISYAGPQWKNVDQFLARIAESFHLPTGASWAVSGSEYQKSLGCDGFAISVFATNGSSQPTLMVTDTSALKLVRDRREAAKEKERQAFKP